MSATLRSVPAHMEPGVAGALAYAIERAERVIEADQTGDAVTTDLYALGLRAATKHRAHPVRVLTAAIDILMGWRDLYRGGKQYGERFGLCVVSEEYADA